jgi:hypothetical protein
MGPAVDGTGAASDFNCCFVNMRTSGRYSHIRPDDFLQGITIPHPAAVVVLVVTESSAKYQSRSPSLKHCPSSEMDPYTLPFSSFLST